MEGGGERGEVERERPGREGRLWQAAVFHGTATSPHPRLLRLHDQSRRSYEPQLYAHLPLARIRVVGRLQSIFPTPPLSSPGCLVRRNPRYAQSDWDDGNYSLRSLSSRAGDWGLATVQWAQSSSAPERASRLEDVAFESGVRLSQRPHQPEFHVLTNG